MLFNRIISLRSRMQKHVCVQHFVENTQFQFMWYVDDVAKIPNVIAFLGTSDFHFQQPTNPATQLRLNNGRFTPSSLAQCLQQCYHDLLAKARQDDVYVEEHVSCIFLVLAAQHQLSLSRIKARCSCSSMIVKILCGYST